MVDTVVQYHDSGRHCRTTSRWWTTLSCNITIMDDTDMQPTEASWSKLGQLGPAATNWVQFRPTAANLGVCGG